MNKETAWLLGYLLSDGCINKPSYRSKGDETHLSFICKFDDREVLHKVKEIFQTRANVREYPNYKSPQAQLNIYDKKDFLKKYRDIKTIIPEQDIKGYERHFIRGLVDGDGYLYSRVRKGKTQKSFSIMFIDEYEHITKWVSDTIIETLNFPNKNLRNIVKDNIWEVRWEGTIARLIAWWLYHGDIESCSLKRKRDKYIHDVLDDKCFNSIDDEILYVSNARIEDNHILLRDTAIKTLEWCHRLQKLLSYKTVPLFHNKGRRKYYTLYLPEFVNMQSAQNKSE